jgi:hypothetical protein|eukprot:COSAG01_NODE_1168_length_11426_cov_339.595038_16_plen_219_part_00
MARSPIRGPAACSSSSGCWTRSLTSCCSGVRGCSSRRRSQRRSWSTSATPPARCKERVAARSRRTTQIVPPWYCVSDMSPASAPATPSCPAHLRPFSDRHHAGTPPGASIRLEQGQTLLHRHSASGGAATAGGDSTLGTPLMQMDDLRSSMSEAALGMRRSKAGSSVSSHGADGERVEETATWREVIVGVVKALFLCRVRRSCRQEACAVCVPAYLPD